MAQLDPNIALQVRQPKLITPQEAQVNGIKLRSLARGEQEALEAQKATRTIRDLYRSSIGENGELDATAFDRGVAAAGYGDQLPGIQKDRATLGKTRADTQASQLKVAKDRMDAVAGGLGSLLANPQVTHADVNAKLSELVDAGVITAEQGAAAARGLPGRPEQLRPFLVQQALSAAEGSKRLEAVLPKYDEQDRGGTINVGTIDNLTGQRTAGEDVTKTLTPGEVQSGKNAETLANAGGSVQTDANGRMIFVPNKVPAGQPVIPRPVVNPDGSQIPGKGLNDSQSKALLFASRGQAANKILEDLSAKGVNRPSVAKEALEGIPLVGGALGAAANATIVSPEQQQVDQAQRDFINATLRRESGAAISPGEFDNAKKQYFVQIGDSPEVIAQKKLNRELAMRGILAEVPEGMRGQIDAPTQPPTQPPAPPATPTNRPPLDAIFGKRR